MHFKKKKNLLLCHFLKFIVKHTIYILTFKIRLETLRLE